ncbi:MAG: hypothetical protein QXG98_02825 [Candidatus Micrarchaeia archaeon]
MSYQLLVGAHAFLGEAGALAFLWVFVELLKPDEARVKRAKLASAAGVLFLFLSWLAGGYAYTTTYGEQVKPVIKGGPLPWAHEVVMETKEHVFLFVPFIAFAGAAAIRLGGNRLAGDAELRFSVLLLSALVVLLVFVIAGMGYGVSTGARAALEAGA